MSLYIYCILASSLYTLFNLYNSWFTFNVSIMHLWHLLSAHFKQSCPENTGAYKPVRYPAPFVITTVDYHVLFSLIMFSNLFILVDIYTVFVLFPWCYIGYCVILYRVIRRIPCIHWQFANPTKHRSHIPQCTSPLSHNAQFCNNNVHMCAHFCYKIAHCGIFV